jgi:hypothetical protein
LNVNTFLEEYAFQERVLVTQHQTFVGSVAMRRLQIMEVLLMNSDRLF